MLFNWEGLNRINKAALIVTFLSTVLLEIVNVSFYKEHQLVVGIFSGSILFSILVQLIKKDIGLWNLFLFLPFASLLIQNGSIVYSQQHIQFIMPLQLICLSGLYLSFGARLFETAWSKNLFGIQSHWLRLNAAEKIRLFRFLLYGPVLLALFHFSLAFLSLLQKDLVNTYHQGFEAIFFFIIYSDFIFLVKTKKLTYEKQLARYYFHISFLFFVFDAMLEQIKYLKFGHWDIFGVAFLAVYLYFAFKPRMTSPYHQATR